MSAQNADLPIELECFLLKWGFFEQEHVPGRKAHAPVHIQERVEEYKAWTPLYPGEEPPF